MWKVPHDPYRSRYGRYFLSRIPPYSAFPWKLPFSAALSLVGTLRSCLHTDPDRSIASGGGIFMSGRNAPRSKNGLIPC